MRTSKHYTNPKVIQKEKEIKLKIYETIRHFASKGYSVKWMCEELGISRQAYYKWLKREETALEKENNEILGEIRQIVTETNGLYGYRKMTYMVNSRMGKNYNFKRIYRLMCTNGIQSSFRKKRRKSTYKKCKPEEVSENILNRKFEVAAPNKVYCTDITEMKYGHNGEKLYISTILDLYDRRLLALSISRSNDTGLVKASIDNLFENNDVTGAIFHSDRGSQYTRSAFKQQLKEHGMIQSMSRVGRCIDNGPMEGIQGILKEIIKVLYPNLETYEQAVEAITKAMEFYNTCYPQERFKGKTANQVREEALVAETPVVYPIPENKKIAAYWADIEAKKQAQGAASEN